MKTGKEIVDKYCYHQGYGKWTVNYSDLVNAIDEETEQATIQQHKEDEVEIKRLLDELKTAEEHIRDL